MQSQGQKFNDQNNQALWSSVGEGRNESGQMFGQQLSNNQNNFNQALGANSQNYGQAMQGSQYANSIRQQQITEALTKRNSSLNEINALQSGGQVGMPQMPNFQGATAAQPAPYMAGAAQDASGANANNPMGGLMDLGGAALGAAATYYSDRRLKTNIKRIGTVKGHPWYTYDYVWGESSEGVMADEIPQEHVTEINGFKAVNYGTLLGE
jgi:hypothetical protein